VRDTRPAYPPEYDEPALCAVCGGDAEVGEGGCSCGECPRCGSVGDPGCYEHGLAPAHDSVASFLDHVGVEPLSDCLRAIDKHNAEHVWLVLRDGRRIYHHSDPEVLDGLPGWTRLEAVGVGGIAWDGSDWEWAREVPPGHGWLDLDAAREAFGEALDEHRGEEEEDGEPDDKTGKGEP